MDEQTKLGLLFNTDLFLVAHTESRKIFGTLIDGLFSSKEKVKNFIRLSGDPTNTYFVYLAILTALFLKE